MVNLIFVVRKARKYDILQTKIYPYSPLFSDVFVIDSKASMSQIKRKRYLLATL